MLHHRGFLSEELFQLKKLIGEFFIKKVSLLVRNVLFAQRRLMSRCSMRERARCTQWAASSER